MSEAFHLYVISFTVGAESGLAMVAAQDEKSAFQILKNSGSRYCEGYSLIQTRDIGMSSNCSYGLLLESFVNAREAFDAIVQASNKLVGPRGYSAFDVAVQNGYRGTIEEWLAGLKGEKGDRGETGSPARFGNITATIDSNIGIPDINIDYSGPEDQKDIEFQFRNLRGDIGPVGPQGPPVPVVADLTTDSNQSALAASMGVELKRQIDRTNAVMNGVAFLGDIVETVE